MVSTGPRRPEGDRTRAGVQILMALTRWGQTGEGDVKHLRGKLSGTRRLRVGDWRVRFQEKKGDIVYILAVSHRSEAYR